MSKIALTGNASGTGTLTIAAPNTNSDRTINLADEAGTLLVNGTSSNVGIGTTSPATKLDVSNGTERHQVSFASGEVYLMARNASAYITQEYIANQHVFTGYGDSSGNEGMKIDSSGRVTTAAQPMFLARENQSSWEPTANADIVWSSTSIYNGYNRGSHYNTSNGRFTCPVAGMYYIEATSIMNKALSNAAWYIYKNGSALHEQHVSQESTSWYAHHIAMTASLAASDYITIRSGSTTLGMYGNAWSYFHVRLIA